MPVVFLSIFRFVRLLMAGHQAVAIENAALRLQLAAFQRKRKRPVLTTFDRIFWVALRRLWSGWRSTLLYVQADTITGGTASDFADSGPDYRDPIIVVRGARPLTSRFAG